MRNQNHFMVIDDETPDSLWCQSLGPLAPNGAPWRCVLDNGHDGVHRCAGDPTWTTSEEFGRVSLVDC